MDFLPLNSYRTRLSLIFEERRRLGYTNPKPYQEGFRAKKRTQLARDTECENLSHVTSMNAGPAPFAKSKVYYRLLLLNCIRLPCAIVSGSVNR